MVKFGPRIYPMCRNESFERIDKNSEVEKASGFLEQMLDILVILDDSVFLFVYVKNVNYLNNIRDLS
jgi:hypothetical protein